MRNPIITFITDFGMRDHYVASMKGVILTVNPKCTLIDITHQVNPQGIQEGAIILANAFSYFPKGTIHLAVVDPGVGSPRKPILIVTQNYFFIGPDNGLLTLAAKKDEVRQIVFLTQTKYFLPQVSATFHGRDIFAPVAGYLSLGAKPQIFGEKTDHCMEIELSKPELRKGKLIGKVIHIDAFGNLVSNIEKREFSRFMKDRPSLIRVGKGTIKDLKRGYWEGKEKEPIALFGSGGFLEISVRDGNAQKLLKVKKGDQIIVTVKSHR